MRAGLSHSPHRCRDVTPQERHPQRTFLGSPPRGAEIHCSDLFQNQTVNFIHTDGHSGNQSRATGIRQHKIYILGSRIWSLYQRCPGNWAIPNLPLPAGIQQRGSSDPRRWLNPPLKASTSTSVQKGTHKRRSSPAAKEEEKPPPSLS